MTSLVYEVQTLAKEVDTDNYYRNQLKNAIEALEGTIYDEIKDLDSLPKDEVDTYKKVLEDKKELVEEYNKIDLTKVKNPKQEYDKFKEKVHNILSQLKYQ